MNHIYGLRIDNKDFKDDMKSVGKGLGYVTRGVGIGLAGGLGGAAAFAGSKALLKGCGKLFNLNTLKGLNVFSKSTLKWAGRAGVGVALLAIIGDAIWRSTSSKD